MKSRSQESEDRSQEKRKSVKAVLRLIILTPDSCFPSLRLCQRKMRLLQIALILKILLTVCWFVPLLCFSQARLKKLGMPAPEPLVFVRLLGAAFLALLVGYLLGLVDLRQGEKPLNTVLVGITSNGLACVVLLYYGLRGEWKEWGKIARACMWASVVFTALVTVLLVVSLLIINW
jgi:hypothetical protein